MMTSEFVQLVERFVQECLKDRQRRLAEGEVEPFTPESEEPLNDASIDEQLDDFFRNYEVEARASKSEGSNSFGRHFLVNEAEDDELAPEDDSIVTSDEDHPPSKLPVQEIDVQAFAGSVGRLIDGFTALIEVERTLLRRAHNFLLENYESSASEEFMRIMREERMLDDDESSWDIEEKDFAAPSAKGAGYDVGGGGGA